MNKLKYYLSTGGYMVKLNLQRQLEYPSFLIGWFLANAMQFAVGIGTLKVITLQFQSINGWSFQEIAFMYGIGIISHALTVILLVQTWYIDSLVIHGGFDRMLLRPMNIYFQFCVCDLNLIGLTDMLPGLIIFCYGAISVGFQLTLVNLMYLFLTIAGAVMIRGGLYTIIGSIGFWTKSSRNLVNIMTSLYDKTMMYPTTIFSRTIQGILTFLLPVGFIAFYPASGFLGKAAGFQIPGPIPLWTFGIGLTLMTLGRLVFRKGLSYYDSAGN